MCLCVCVCVDAGAGLMSTEQQLSVCLQGIDARELRTGGRVILKSVAGEV